MYGSGKVEGPIFDDKVAAVSGGASVSVIMLGVDIAAVSFAADGIMGMAPTSNGKEQLFVTQFYEGGAISENGFGVNYRDSALTSTILLGGWDTTIVANESLFSYVPLKDTGYWSLPIGDITYGNVSMKMSAGRGILDTGTSLTYFEQDDFDLLWKTLSNGKTCGTSIVAGWYACE